MKFLLVLGVLILVLGAVAMAADLNRPVPYTIFEGKNIPKYTRIGVDTYPLFYQPTFSVWDALAEEYVTVRGSMTFDFFQCGIIAATALWITAFATAKLRDRN